MDEKNIHINIINKKGLEDIIPKSIIFPINFRMSKQSFPDLKSVKKLNDEINIDPKLNLFNNQNNQEKNFNISSLDKNLDENKNFKNLQVSEKNENISFSDEDKREEESDEEEKFIENQKNNNQQSEKLRNKSDENILIKTKTVFQIDSNNLNYDINEFSTSKKEKSILKQIFYIEKKNDFILKGIEKKNKKISVIVNEENFVFLNNHVIKEEISNSGNDQTYPIHISHRRSRIISKVNKLKRKKINKKNNNKKNSDEENEETPTTKNVNIELNKNSNNKQSEIEDINNPESFFTNENLIIQEHDLNLKINDKNIEDNLNNNIIMENERNMEEKLNLIDEQKELENYLQIFDEGYLVEKNEDKTNKNINEEYFKEVIIFFLKFKLNKKFSQLEYQADKQHPRLISENKELILFPICETKIGCMGCCKTYEKSDLEVTGLGVLVYMKILKSFAIIFFLISIFNGFLIWVYSASHSEASIITYRDLLFKTTIGNIGSSIFFSLNKFQQFLIVLKWT